MRDSVMWFLVGSVLISALFVVKVRHQHRLAYLAFQSEETRRDALNDEWGQLLVEAHTYSSAHLVEKVAMENLSMRAPKKDEIKYVGNNTAGQLVGLNDGSN